MKATLAYNNRGMCYDDLEEFELALEDYEKSIELTQQITGRTSIWD